MKMRASKMFKYSSYNYKECSFEHQTRHPEHQARRSEHQTRHPELDSGSILNKCKIVISQIHMFINGFRVKSGMTLGMLLLSPSLAIAENSARDPFMPFMWEKPAAGGASLGLQALDAQPLTEKPLSSYRIIGIIVSPTDSIALVKSRDKREYFASIGDHIGSEGGIIDIISSEGITVDINGKIVDLNVSNRFDIQNESN